MARQAGLSILRSRMMYADQMQVGRREGRRPAAAIGCRKAGRSRTGGWLACQLVAAFLVVVLNVDVGWAVRVGDITQLKGQRTNKLVGVGLVVGLKATGDGGDFGPAIRPLAALLTKFADPVMGLDELKDAKNVAIVSVEATLPDNGVREGDEIDVSVSALGPAKSLTGGRLFLTPLLGPAPGDQRVFALASGPIHTVDTKTPTVGVVRRGARMEADVIHNYTALGRELEHRNPWIEPDGLYITLVIDHEHASYGVAHTISQMINEDTSGPGDMERIALAADPKSVLVHVPRVELEDPAPFIARIEALDLLMPVTEARVKINRKSQTIVVTGDVEISPVVISHADMTITTVIPAPPPDPNNPRVEQRRWVALDPQRQGGAKLMDLLQALEQLKVPAKDQIQIIEELQKTGKLHARLIVEN